MKTKIKTIVLFAILSVLQVNAQETKMYLPVFSDTDTTRFYFAAIDGMGNAHAYLYFDCIKDMENENIYHLIREGWLDYEKFEVNKDNSKLWGIYVTSRGDTIRNLLMDLNLNVGDKFNGHTVAKVYYKDERRHIEFERKFYTNASMCVDENLIFMDDIPFIFIEGVGPNAFVEEAWIGIHEIMPSSWLYARYRNGEFEYGIKDGTPPRSVWVNPPGFPDWVWEEIFTCEKETGIKETRIRTLSIIPNPSRDNVQIALPEIITEEMSLTISDLSGRVIETVAIDNNSFVLDISRYAPATYIAVIEAGNYRYVGRIIKK
jgi:hypothetical protein